MAYIDNQNMNVNMFDAMDQDSPLKLLLQTDDETSCYLNAPHENLDNVLLWWIKQKATPGIHEWL